ncbi:cytokine receptor isoform X2 [Neocloeon triangulifer]|uniref:cytokine receptor isoform X2 n=1 Tax=Neocloeon triangulifer TaxID=2078957 RepID=UPI00286F5EFD|nr:cytokine receptor isoform X2 [Neocloeon triangulifer]
MNRREEWRRRLGRSAGAAQLSAPQSVAGSPQSKVNRVAPPTEADLAMLPPRQCGWPGFRLKLRIVPNEASRRSRELTESMARSGTVCLLLLAALLLPCEANGCMPGLSTPGVTWPRGDIVLEEGNPLRINCTVYPDHNMTKGRDSSYLTFYNGTHEISHEHISVLNDTTVQLLMTDLPLSNKTVMYCKLRKNKEYHEKVVCLNKVIVGKRPQEVKNFSCFSQNWQALTCRWDVEEHFLPTDYHISWSLPGRAGRNFQKTLTAPVDHCHGDRKCISDSFTRMSVSCPTKSDADNNTCTWNLSTTPIYRQPFEYYYIIMNASNALGNITFPSIKFHHYAHVIPAPPENLQAHNLTAHSVTLTWAIPYPLQNFPPGLIHRVEYRHKWLPKDRWIMANTSHLNPRAKNLTLHLSNLPYAFTEYSIRVQMKSHAARDSSYSEPSVLQIKTAAIRPGASPKTDTGSFEILGDLHRRDIYIYWQHIPEYYHNGDNFDYKIVQEDENGDSLTLTPSETTVSFAKIKGLSHHMHKFKIYASNSVGQSLNPSIITIPSHSNVIKEPLSFTKIEFGRGIYELSWNEPLSDEQTTLPKIVNYTIFWCDSERDRPHQCTGNFNWTHVPANVNTINITVPDDKKIYQFAISANGANTSSGLSWTVCTAIHNKGLGKMKDVWLNKVGSKFIEVGWRLECSNRIGLVTGYNISYCPIVSAQNRSCREPAHIEYVAGDATTIHGNISELMPYTTYMYQVSVVSRGGQGMPSDAHLATTLEAAPDPPTSLEVANVTNSSLYIQWNPPVNTNGNVKFYEIHFDKNSTRVDGSITEVTLQNLPSFTNHSVYLTACTIACSEESNVIWAKTLIGNPGMIERLIVKRVNASKFLVWWEPPPVHGGHIDFYELSVQVVDGSNNSMNKKYTNNVTELIVPVTDCSVDEKRRTYVFSVRAVNVDEHNQTFYGPWSEPQERDNCFDSGFSSLSITLLSVFIVACTLVGLLWFYGKKAWFSVKEMRAVEVDLPPGLDPSLQDIMGFGPAQKPVDPSRVTPADLADSEMLLTKSERHGRNPSGDSSGCSSAGGHEDSISSSLTSNRQISTDSGTEVDQMNEGSNKAPSDLGHADEDEDWEFRATPVQQPGVQPDAYPCLQYCRVGAPGAESPVGPYIRVGEQAPPSVATAPNLTNKSGGYVSLEQVPRASPVTSASGYVSHPYVWKPSASPSTADPSSSSASSSASGSPTLPPAAPNGYTKVGNADPAKSGPAAAATPVAASSGYVALGNGGVPVIRRPAASNYVPHGGAPPRPEAAGEGDQ